MCSESYCWIERRIVRSRHMRFFFKDPATTEIYTLSLHDALPIYRSGRRRSKARSGGRGRCGPAGRSPCPVRSEEHTSELQSRRDLVCRLLLEKKKTILIPAHNPTDNSMFRSIRISPHCLHTPRYP